MARKLATHCRKPASAKADPVEISKASERLAAATMLVKRFAALRTDIYSSFFITGRSFIAEPG
ncbi:hypothetical protein MES5069_740111 [Mesorhizobium escarrei]|uniref:Transposase n=1 Tax=Mesorhizobium escarrei TaxID=666018 RepID=A0ABM9EHY6_9HYPH|nr:hypothetical protein MES5069_740111 [Mesorhizobium escarrei]